MEFPHLIRFRAAPMSSHATSQSAMEEVIRLHEVNGMPLHLLTIEYRADGIAYPFLTARRELTGYCFSSHHSAEAAHRNA